MQDEKFSSARVTPRGQAQYGAVFLLSIYSFIPVAGKKKRYLIDKIYCGTPVSIAEQIYLLCGQQPSHRFLASILVPLFLKYWLTPGLESYLTNESMYGQRERGRETEGREKRHGRQSLGDIQACKLSYAPANNTKHTYALSFHLSSSMSL